MAGKILITPNTGSTTVGQDPTIKYQGIANSTDITQRVTSTGSLSFEGTTGQLFSITDSMTGTIFSVNDVSGIPSIEVLDTGLVKIAQYSGNVLIGGGTDDGNKVQVYGALAVDDATLAYPVILNEASNSIYQGVGSTNSLVVRSRAGNAIRLYTDYGTGVRGGNINLYAGGSDNVAGAGSIQFTTGVNTQAGYSGVIKMIGAVGYWVGNISGSGATAIDLGTQQSTYLDVSLTAATTFSFVTTSAIGSAPYHAVRMRIAATSFAITWPGSVAWISGSAPTLSATTYTIVELITYDGGTTYRGWTVGAGGSGGGGTTTAALTFNNVGSGAASGTTFNGSVAQTISYNSVGAPSTAGTGATGTWAITAAAANALTTTNAYTVAGLTVNSTSATGIYQTGNVAGAMGMNVTNANATGYAQISLTSNGITKSLRTNSSGTLELVNSANNAVIFNVTDTGSMSTYAPSATSLITSQSGGSWGGFYAKSAATNNSYMFFGDVGGEKGRITSATDGSMSFSRGNAATVSALLDASGNFSSAGTVTGVVLIGSGTPSVGQFHAAAGSASTWYNSIWRNDGSNVYLLSSAVQTTQAAANTASWNTFRPFAWNLSNGTVQLCGDGAQVSAGGNFVATGNVTAYSDERLKTDWAPLALNYVGQLANIKSGSFTRIDNGERQVGVSAQSLQTLLPEAVMDSEHLSVAYGNAAMVSAVELAKEVVSLKSEVALLKELVTALLAK